MLFGHNSGLYAPLKNTKVNSVSPEKMVAKKSGGTINFTTPSMCQQSAHINMSACTHSFQKTIIIDVLHAQLPY